MADPKPAAKPQTEKLIALATIDLGELEGKRTVISPADPADPETFDCPADQAKRLIDLGAARRPGKAQKAEE